ncbi:hypothetical protein [Chryseobacterium potabilaquae]|uniref:Uncharacterized protein n=1 Tax=Chryseobacterium potabilaquae TaxID=2675057 RepID=A0A6N4XG88_9FLAO|nr:hypothetical protein [Chryseobacterium potabilaquae]CAA7197658.1 hypothetical protein CHRY9293_03731 [Chryseobacterium potabilaquae]
MKNVFNKNAKVIATTVLAAVITISMSFKSQEKIEANANETAASIQNAQIKNVSQAKWPAAAVGASAAAVGALVQVANFATNHFFGGGRAMDESTNEKDLINSEQIKASQFD